MFVNWYHVPGFCHSIISFFICHIKLILNNYTVCIATLILMVLIVLVLNKVNKISEKMFEFKHSKKK